MITSEEIKLYIKKICLASVQAAPSAWEARMNDVPLNNPHE